MEGKHFTVAEFVGEWKRTLVSPKTFFAAMPKDGGAGRAAAKALVYGLAAGIVAIAAGIALKLLGYPSAVSGTLLVIAPVISIIGLLAGTLVLTAITALCGGDTRLSATFAAAAALLSVEPVQPLLIIPTMANVFLGAALSIALGGFGLWLLYHALAGGLSVKPGRAKAAVLVIAVLVVAGNTALIMIHRMPANMKAVIAGIRNGERQTGTPNDTAGSGTEGAAARQNDTADQYDPKELEEYTALMNAYVQAVQSGDAARGEEIMKKIEAIPKKYGKK